MALSSHQTMDVNMWCVCAFHHIYTVYFSATRGEFMNKFKARYAGLTGYF